MSFIYFYYILFPAYVNNLIKKNAAFSRGDIRKHEETQ